MRAKSYEVQHIQADRIAVEWTCVKCKTEHVDENLEIERTGGCFGHEPGEYCYCDSMKFISKTQCEKCGINTTISMPGSGD